jgi:hypothetical protein
MCLPLVLAWLAWLLIWLALVLWLAWWVVVLPFAWVVVLPLWWVSAPVVVSWPLLFSFALACLHCWLMLLGLVVLQTWGLGLKKLVLVLVYLEVSWVPQLCLLAKALQMVCFLLLVYLDWVG